MRLGARVLVIDAADRVLLFTSEDDAGRSFWYRPGGGSDPGEPAEATAQRELREETGLGDVELTAEIWQRPGLASWGAVTYDCH